VKYLIIWREGLFEAGERTMNDFNRDVDDRIINQICRLLNQTLGFYYGTQKKYLICTRLNKRLNELNIDNYTDYLKILEKDSVELNRFYDLLTTNVTNFFREADQFEILKQKLLPELMERHLKERKISCWSAGCSSGEEAYTLAIVLSEALHPGWEFRVLASDISIQKLHEGMAGIYPLEKLQILQGNLIQKYFQKIPGRSMELQVKPELRRRVVFRRINLNEEFHIPNHIKFDVIFCRNVFIYLSSDTRARIIDGFYSCLTDGGYLFMGHSEAINTYADSRWESKKDCVYKKVERPKVKAEG
jgi:chemotaxis protein methyltransferase CheR